MKRCKKITYDDLVTWSVYLQFFLKARKKGKEMGCHAFLALNLCVSPYDLCYGMDINSNYFFFVNKY